ncbi:MAG: AAA family ATPase [Bacteroidales bacterium]|nr:AAA family ATPase [Bacteroidales bacterium]
MITKLRLINWKSFKDSTLYIDPLTVLIGVNASGKSNVLDAFDFLKNLFAPLISYDEAMMGMPNNAIKATPYYSFKDAIKNIRGGKDWVIKRGETECDLEITLKEGDEECVLDVKILQTNNGNITIQPDIIHLNGEDLTPPDFNSSDYFKWFFAQTSNGLTRADIIYRFHEIARRNLHNILVFNPIPEKMRGYSPVSSELKPDGSNIAGVIAALNPEDKEKLEAELTKYVSPLPEKDIKKIQAVTVGLNNSDAMLYCFEEWNPDKAIDARGMSDGTLRFAAIVLALLTAKPHSLLVIEEIDNGLHPSRAKQLVKVLKEISIKRSVDVLCTTHNPTLINELGGEMIPFINYVKRDADGNSVIELLEEKDNLAKLMASSSIGDLMTEDKL